MRPGSEMAYLVLVNESDEEIAAFAVAGYELEIEAQHGLTDITTSDDPEGMTRLMLVKEEED